MKYSHGNKTCKVEVHELDKVEAIKVKIQNQEGLPTHSKVLKFNDEILEDSQYLVLYYNIQDNSILDLEGG